MSLLEEFMGNIAGSGNNILDFEPVISSSGDFKKIYQLNAVLKSWSRILLTPIRTYDHDPEYGSELFNYIFTILDEESSENIKREIVYKLEHYDNRATIVDVNISILSDRKGFSVDIEAEYKGESGNISVNFDENLIDSQS